MHGDDSYRERMYMSVNPPPCVDPRRERVRWAAAAASSSAGALQPCSQHRAALADTRAASEPVQRLALCHAFSATLTDGEGGRGGRPRAAGLARVRTCASSAPDICRRFAGRRRTH